MSYPARAEGLVNMINAGSRGQTKVSLRDVTIVRDETGEGVRATTAPEARRGLWRMERKLES